MQLLLASGNQKKLAELRRIATPLGVEVLCPADIGGLPDVEEDGATFAANAAKKAAFGAQHSGLWTLADDSGLAVDALKGGPGVFSARFAGVHGDDEANNRKLLHDLADVPDEERGAAFLCALALATPKSGEIAHETVGRTSGEILREAQGTGGFGYDPLFRFTEPGFPVTGKVFGSLTAEEKASVSHRGRALRDLEPVLAKLLQDS